MSLKALDLRVRSGVLTAQQGSWCLEGLGFRGLGFRGLGFRV